MRTTTSLIGAILLTLPLAAQQRRPDPRTWMMARGPEAIEASVKQWSETLASVRKTYERDVGVLEHLKNADKALVDPMQPTIAVQKAYEEVVEAKRLEPEFHVRQGVIHAEEELENARRSPMSADFGRLRSILAEHALGPARRVVSQDAAGMQAAVVAWLKVQDAVAEHLRALSEMSSEGLRQALE